MESVWVQRELEYFLEKHDKEHVITVLVGGEPEESFPDILCRETKTINDINGETLTVTVPVEPLAADVRGKNKNESLKKLNVEILRLLACMLGCHYDSLKQRHREYLIKRTTCIASTIIIAMSIFGGYAYFQLQQIRMEHEASLKYQKESIQNQAKNLAQQSVDVLAEGKREEALKKALAVDLEMLTNENTEEDIIPEQMYALNSALYSYRDGHRILFAPECTMDIQGIANGCFSKDGTWYYAWNESNEGYVFSGENGQLLCKINTSEIESITEGDSKIVRLIPYRQNNVIVVMVHAVAVLNAHSNEFIEIFPVETDLTNISSYDLEGNHLILNTEQVMCLCDVEKGKVLHSVNVYDILGYQHNGDYINPTIKDVDIATNGTKAVCAVTCSENLNTEIPGLFTYDFTTKECQIFSMIQTTDVNYIDDSHIIVIHKEVPEVRKGTIDAHAYYKYYSAVYDIISGEILYTSEKAQILDSYYSGIEIMNLTEGDEKYLVGIYWIDNNISIINLNTYEFYGMIAMDDSILNVIQFGENSFLIGSVDGWIQRIVLSDMILRFDCMDISAALSGIEYNIANGKLVVLTDGTAIFCGNSIDKEMRTITYENLSGSVENIEYYEAGKEIYRCVNLLSSDYIYEGSIFYKSGSDKPVISFRADNQGDYSAIIDIFEKNEQDFAYIVEADAYGIATEIHTINLTEGKETGVLDLSSYGIETFYDFSFNKTHEMFFAETQKGLEAFFITDTAIKKQENFHLEDKYSIKEWKMTGDGEWIFLCEQKNDLSTDGIQNHVILNTLTGQFKQIKMDIETEGAVLIAGSNSSRLCIQDGQFLHLIDCDEGKELSHITLTTDANVKMSFFR